jgi:hypothetical protein
MTTYISYLRNLYHLVQRMSCYLLDLRLWNYSTEMCDMRYKLEVIELWGMSLQDWIHGDEHIRLQYQSVYYL